MTTFDQSSDGREISLTSGDEFEVQLVENPTTGFRWRLTSDGAPALACIKDDFRTPSAARPGEPGLHVWHFRCDAAGACELRFVNARRGATEETAGRSYTLRIRTQPNE